VTNKEKGVWGCGFSSLEIVVETYFGDFKVASSYNAILEEKRKRSNANVL
jgi:hypothetical protein